jgi:hypothetical protein
MGCKIVTFVLVLTHRRRVTNGFRIGLVVYEFNLEYDRP